VTKKVRKAPDPEIGGFFRLIERGLIERGLIERELLERHVSACEAIGRAISL